MKIQKYLIIIICGLILISLTGCFLKKIDPSQRDVKLTNPTEQSDGMHEEIPIDREQTENIKDLSKYSNKEVFLVSDKDWRQALTLIPIAIWTNKDNTITKYPLLIYHKENNAFDIDSIYHFFEQYNPSKISYFENLPSELNSLLQNSFDIEQKQNTLDYWKEYQDVVYVADNYEFALLASTYASLINSPLIIEGYSDNIDLSQKNVICVGSPTLNCDKQYSLEQLQEEYLKKTSTNKIILINQDDISINLNAEFQTDKSSHTITELYGKASLASPILASAKHELILGTNSKNYNFVDQFIENSIASLGMEADYLTIMASPDAIQMSKNEKEDIWFEVDNSIYGHLGDEVFQSFSVGRIFGISVSDVSSYVSRVLFYDDLPISDKFAMLVPYGQRSPREAIGGKIQLKPSEDLLELSGLQSKSFYLDETSYESFPLEQALKDKILIVYSGHGSPIGVQKGINTESLRTGKIWLSSPFVIVEGCLTCAYEGIWPGLEKKDLLCTNFLRRGSLGYIGAIDESGATSSLSKYFVENLVEGNSLGESLKNLKHFESTVIGNCREGQSVYHPFCEPFFILVGDPTVSLGFEYPEIDVIEVKNEINNLNLISTITIPQSNQLESWSDYSIYKIPHGINGIKNYIEIDPNDPSGNSLRSDGIFTFDVDLPDGYSLNPIKAEFIDSESNVIVLSFEQEEDGVIDFINFDIPGKRFVLSIEPIYDERTEKYKLFVYTSFGGEFIIGKFSPSYRYKIYWELKD